MSLGRRCGCPMLRCSMNGYAPWGAHVWVGYRGSMMPEAVLGRASGHPRHPLRVLALIPSLRGGGAERRLADLLRAFDRKVIQPEVAFVYHHEPTFSIPSDVPVHFLEDEEPFSANVLPLDVPLNASAADLEAAQWMGHRASQLQMLVARRRPDCVLALSLWSSVFAPVALRKIRGIPVVATVDTYSSDTLRRSKHPAYMAWSARRYLNMATRIITHTTGVAEDLVGTFGVPASRVVTVPKGVDHGRIAEAVREPIAEGVLDPGVPTVLYVGRLAQVKGVDLLLRAISRALGRHPFQLVIVGDGEERSGLERLAEELGVASHVKFLGWQKNPYAFMGQAAILVVPSLSEGLSYVVLEGLACGCPIVASDVPSRSLREALCDGKAGLLVPPGDAEALANALVRLLEDRALREQLAHEAQLLASRYSLENSVRAYERVIREAVEEEVLRYGRARLRLWRWEDRLAVAWHKSRERPRRLWAAVANRTARSARQVISLALPRGSIHRRWAARVLGLLRRRTGGWGKRGQGEIPGLPSGGGSGNRCDPPGPAGHASCRSEIPALFFVPTLESGGAERVCVAYVNAATKVKAVLALQFKLGPLLSAVSDRVEVLELHRTGIPRDRGTLRRAFRRLVKLVAKVAGKVPLLKETVFVLREARTLARVARRVDCAVVSSFITAPNVIAVLAKLLFNRKLKVVVNVHDLTSEILVHTHLKRSNQLLLRWLVRLLYPRADAVVAVASGIKADLARSFGVPAKKIIVVHNPIDIATLRDRAAEAVTEPWFVARDYPLLVAVGRLTRLKGFHHLIEAMSYLPARVRLTIVGGGEEEVALGHQVVRAGLTERVLLLGYQDNPWKYMARADIFVLSSLTEGWPNVVGEAMALGLPIVATDCSPGVREFLEDGRCGLLVPPGDRRALADAIQRLLADNTLRQELAARGRERAAEFNLPDVVRTYEDLLLAVAHSANNGR